MNILGLDPATLCGFALASDGEIVKSGTWALPARPDDHCGKRLVSLEDEILGLHANHRLDKIAYELASFGSHNPQVQAFHNEIAGVIKRVAYLIGPVPCIGFPIGTIKVFACGNGRAKKPQMVAAAKLQFGIVVRDDNEADAIFVAKLAEHEHEATRRRIKRARSEGVVKQPKLF